MKDSKIRRLFSASIATVMMLSGVLGMSVQAAEATAAEENGTSILIQNGVQVTMSSSAMPAASSKLNTGDSGTARPSGWLTDDPTTVDYRNTPMEAINLTKRTSDNATIVIDESKTYQNFAGVGTSMEHTTVWNLMQLDEGKRREVIRYMIDPVNGLGMSMFRLSIGTSDFFPLSELGGTYSYYDIPGNVAPQNPDWYNETGSGFSIQKDRDFGIITVLQTIMEEARDLGIEDEVRFYASPWSPLGWMKTGINASVLAANPTGMSTGGLSNSHVNNAAMYYVRFLEEYALEGIPIYSMSLQNQSVLDLGMLVQYGMMSAADAAKFPNSSMTAQRQADMANKMREYIAASSILNDEQKNVKLLALDYPWGESSSDTFARTVLNTAPNAVDGVAFHDYRANPIFAGLRAITQEYPGKTVALSERALNGTYGMDRIVNYYQNHAISYTSWVTMCSTKKDDKAGTQADEVMLMRNPDRDNEVRYLPEANMIGQFGKIRTGYVRVDSTLGKAESDNFGITNVVFKDPETHKLVMVVVNNSNEEKPFTVAGDAYQFEAKIPATTVATYTWNPSETGVIEDSNLKLTTEAHNVMQDGYANITTEFIESVNSNTAILNYTFDTALFEYADFHLANGVTVVSKEATANGAKVVVMVQDYNTQAFGSLAIHAKADAKLATGRANVKADVEYVVKDTDGGKEIKSASASTSFTTLGDGTGEPVVVGDTNNDRVVNLLDLSDMVDWFDTKNDDPKWEDFYTYYDFNHNGEIDVSDIAFVARLIA